MKRSLFSFFIRAHIFVGVISLTFVALFGSYMIERHLEESTEETLLYIADSIAGNSYLPEELSAHEFEHMKQVLSSIAFLQNTSIWVLRADGSVVFSSESQYPDKLKKFSVKNWDFDSSYVGKFFGVFEVPRISVMVPIKPEASKAQGYIAVHYRLDKLYATRSNIMGIVLLVFFLMYSLSFSLLLLYRHRVHLPMRKIMAGASEFANGNLNHVIPINSDDELGYLSNSLNYMAEKLDQNSSYQRTFIANISHDFRSPLTSIKGYVEAMLDGTIPYEFQNKYLNIIASETHRLEKLTRSLLTLNDIDISKRMLSFQIFDICQTIDQIINTFEGRCQKRNIQLTFISSSKAIYVSADLERIKQVIHNLLDNAIKFSPDHTEIILEVTEKKGKIFVSIKDHGCGISSENLPKIWDRFYKTDTSRGKDRKGTGLGLSIVKEIISAHNENINVISTEGVGTEFIFTLEKSKNNLTAHRLEK